MTVTIELDEYDLPQEKRNSQPEELSVFDFPCLTREMTMRADLIIFRDYSGWKYILKSRYPKEAYEHLNF